MWEHADSVTRKFSSNQDDSLANLQEKPYNGQANISKWEKNLVASCLSDFSGLKGMCFKIIFCQEIHISGIKRQTHWFSRSHIELMLTLSLQINLNLCQQKQNDWQKQLKHMLCFAFYFGQPLEKFGQNPVRCVLSQFYPDLNKHRGFSHVPDEHANVVKPVTTE